ncbi:MAG TPA: bacillithiol biosynthesis cysteine-adding enzyme BshC [Pyrinomonadaceae bacterium]|nr:bacillithiol biosynthesis cysteine-adding enzyme BshC [Pyrinomonadaceae bacterium]
MSTAETACHSTPEQAGLRVENLPFAQIPQQTRLFLDYLDDPSKLRRFYPEAVKHHYELPERRDRVLTNYLTNRAALCDALERMNRAWRASRQTLDNINRLREVDCIAVVSGQQAGLFGGPLYTVYKALSAVKLAECLAQRGIKIVPVFWIATEDHDFAEVAQAGFINRDCMFNTVGIAEQIHTDRLPVGHVTLDQSIETTVQSLLSSLPKTEFTDDLETLLRDSYGPGKKFGDAFAQIMTALLGHKGLILVDPLDLELKKLAAPIYADAADHAHEIAAAIVARSRDLEAAGYHAQVTPTDDCFPLFIHDENGARRALVRNSRGKYHAKGDGQDYSADEIAGWTLREPERFSPSVNLRSVVQDFLFPTIAYYGGSAEIVYFGQISEVYRILERPVTPILPRFSLTFVEKHTWRALERYGIRLQDFFGGADHVIAQVVAGYLGQETSAAFEHTTETFNKELDGLQQQLKRVDPTLADALEKGRRKINYQIDGLRTRFNRAQVARDEAVQRQLEHAADLLYPEKTLQERRLNITSLLARHGRYVIDWIFDAIDLDSNQHEIVYL